jgi:hypothetical protein
MLVAALTWTAVGSALAGVGLRRLVAAGGVWGGSLVLALVAGWLKARWVLAARAETNARRIEAAGDGRCIGGVFSWTAWALVAGMMLAGWALRRTPVPAEWTGWVEAAVGAALLFAARIPWRHWRRLARAGGG